MKNKKVNLLEGPLVKNILLYALPIMATGVLQLLFNAADMVVVGRYAGDVALAAVGSTGALINLIVNLLIGLSVGASVIVAQYFGAGNEKGVRRTVHTAIPVALIGGLFAGTVGFVGSRTFLGWMGCPLDVIDKATLYLRIYFVGVPMMMLYNFGAAILRSVGDTRRPLIFLTSSGVLNVILNLIFVIALGMDVDGVALATTISQSGAAILVITYLMRVKGCFSLDLRKLHIYRHELFTMIRIGIPAGIQGSVFSISNVLIQSSINSFGKVVMAGNSAAANVEGFAWTAMNSYHQAAMTFIGQNLGAGKLERINKIMLTNLWMVATTGAVISAAVLIFARPLLGIYCTEDPSAIDYGVLRFQIVISAYVINGVMDMLTGAIRGMGASFVPMMISIMGICGIRIVWIATVFRKFRTLEMLFAIYPISWVITTATLFVCYFVVYKSVMKRAKMYVK